MNKIYKHRPTHIEFPKIIGKKVKQPIVKKVEIPESGKLPVKEIKK